MADTDSSRSRQDREQTELWTTGTEQSSGPSGVSRKGEDGEVKGTRREFNNPGQVADTAGIIGKWAVRVGGETGQPETETRNGGVNMADPGRERLQGIRPSREEESFQTTGTVPLYPPGPGDRGGWSQLLSIVPEAEPTFCRTLNGPTAGVDLRLRAVGNGVVPAVAAVAFINLAAAIAARSGFPNIFLEELYE